MVRYRRNLIPGATYFFTVALQDRRATTLVDHVDLLRSSFAKVRSAQPFRIEALVVLPEHLHALITMPPGDSNYPRLWRRLKGHFTQHVAASGVPVPRFGDGRYALWQRRYWEHTIRDAKDFERHVDYIHFNPVKHGWVRSVADWPHSSFHRFVRKGVLAQDWGGTMPNYTGAFGEPSA
jgi:putative transposase